MVGNCKRSDCVGKEEALTDLTAVPQSLELRAVAFPALPAPAAIKALTVLCRETSTLIVQSEAGIATANPSTQFYG